MKREDDEEQHSGDVSKPKAYRGLSNELICKIYDEVFAAEHAKTTSKGPQPRLNDILLSKRIYAVARPAWLYGLKIVLSARLVDRAVAGLMQDDAACAAVRAFEIKVFPNQEFTTAAMLGRLPNLWLLWLSFYQEHGHDIYNALPCPNSIVKVLAKFPRLRQLEFLDPVTFQTDFPVCPSQLRHVTAAIQSFSPRFSAFLQQSAVQTLLIFVGFSVDLAFGRGVARGDLPWASLRQLTLRFGPDVSPFSAQSLLDSLDAQVCFASSESCARPLTYVYFFSFARQVLAFPGPLPLRKLVIDLLGKGVDFAAIVDSTLSTFAPRGATSFRFHTVETAGFSPMGSFGGAVQELSIFSQTPYNLTKGVRPSSARLFLISEINKAHILRPYSATLPISPAFSNGCRLFVASIFTDSRWTATVEISTCTASTKHESPPNTPCSSHCCGA